MIPEELCDLAHELCRLRQSGEFVPILEADVCGLLYHLVLAKGISPLHRLHLETRIIGAGSDRDRFDLVIGDVCRRPGGVPAVNPETVVEVKVFPGGFTSQQCRIRLEHIIGDDLRKLGTLRDQSVPCFEFIYDELGFLSKTYGGARCKDLVVLARNRTSPQTHLVIAWRSTSGWDVSIL